MLGASRGRLCDSSGFLSILEAVPWHNGTMVNPSLFSLYCFKVPCEQSS